MVSAAACCDAAFESDVVGSYQVHTCRFFREFTMFTRLPHDQHRWNHGGIVFV